MTETTKPKRWSQLNGTYEFALPSGPVLTVNVSKTRTTHSRQIWWTWSAHAQGVGPTVSVGGVAPTKRAALGVARVELLTRLRESGAY